MSVLGKGEERGREVLARVFAFLDLVHPALLVLGRGHGRRLRSGSVYLELDRGIRFCGLSAIYLWVEGE